jgi:hypothetical protein
MKKLIAIFLLLVYSFTAYGITISRHFCRGNAKETAVVNFFHPVKCCCAETGMPDDCCNNEIKKADTDDHNATANVLFDTQPQFHLFDHGFLRLQLLLFAKSANTNEQFVLENSPPNRLPLFLVLQVFRI